MSDSSPLVDDAVITYTATVTVPGAALASGASLVGLEQLGIQRIGAALIDVCPAHSTVKVNEQIVGGVEGEVATDGPDVAGAPASS